MVYANKPGKMKIPSNVFHCKDGTYIAETSLCDGIEDCPEGTDENQCNCTNASDLYHVNCKYLYNNISHTYSCTAYYFTCVSSFTCIPYSKVCDFYEDCFQGEDEFCRFQADKDLKIVKNVSIAIFACLKNNKTIPASLVDDFIPDCPNTFEDEIQYYNLMTNPFHNHSSCQTKEELPCIPGHSHCFPLNKLCIFEFQTKTLILEHCRNGAHLYNCTNFQCSEYFKCPMSYCIPFDLICNGKWDCPDGHDEMNCHTFSCPKLFKCKNQTKCLHFSKLCNRNKDCIFGDDELWCTNISLLVCPSNCVCFAQSIICNHINKIVPNNIWFSTKYFRCFSCDLGLGSTFITIFQFIRFLDIKKYSFPYICMDKFNNLGILFSIHHFDVSSNSLTTTKGFCFSTFQSLIVFYLQNNSISNLEKNSFHSLLNLNLLDLSSNKITKLKRMVFSGLANIKEINLKFNKIVFVHGNIFKELPSNTVHSNNVKVCCMSGPWTECKVKYDAHSNCNDLIPKQIMKYVCWLTGIFSVLLNSASFILQIRQKQYVYLATVDCMFGIHLLIIACADLYFKGSYVGYELVWKDSILCKISSFSVFVSMMISPIMLCVIMIARYCVVKWPLTSAFTNQIYMKRVMKLWIIIAIFACIFLFSSLFGFHKNYTPTGLCLALFKSKEQSLLLLLTSLPIILVQMSCLLIILILAILLKTQLKSHIQLKSKNIKSEKVTIQLFLTTMAMMCCWIPSSIAFMLPILGYQVSYYLFNWIIILVVPINSVLDPLLFSILTPQMRKNYIKLWNRLNFLNTSGNLH